MKLPALSVFLVIARLGQSLQSLQESFRRWAPQQAPELVPIPIRAERRIRGQANRHRHRGS